VCSCLAQHHPCHEVQLCCGPAAALHHNGVCVCVLGQRADGGHRSRSGSRQGTWPTAAMVYGSGGIVARRICTRPPCAILAAMRCCLRVAAALTLCLLLRAQVCGCSVLLAALSYPASRFWYKRNWQKVNQNEAFERRMSGAAGICSSHTAATAAVHSGGSNSSSSKFRPSGVSCDVPERALPACSLPSSLTAPVVLPALAGHILLLAWQDAAGYRTWRTWMPSFTALTQYRHSYVDRKLFKQLLLEVMGSRRRQHTSTCCGRPLTGEAD